MGKRSAADIVRNLRQSADLTERLAVDTENSTRHRNEMCNARLMREAADRLEAASTVTPAGDDDFIQTVEWFRNQIASGDIERK